MQQFNITIAFTGSQQEIVEQMDLMKEYIASRAPHEIIQIKRTDVIVQQLPDKPKPPQYVPNNRVITAQDNTRTDVAQLRGTEQLGSRVQGRIL